MRKPVLEEIPEPAQAVSTEIQGRTNWELFRSRFVKDKAAMTGAVILLILVILAITAPLFAKALDHGPNELFP